MSNPLPKKNKPKFIIKLSSYDVKMLENVVKEISRVCKNSAVDFSIIPMPTDKKLFVVLKSPFIYTISRDQLMYKKHRRSIFLNIQQPGQLNEMFKDFNIPDGISIEVENYIKK